MHLAPGTRLGSYEIVGPLGSGGMGEVYKARDPRLQRFVAIKILPAVAALDAERRERFQREAQVIAALNHPNIVTIYSVEQQGDGAFITMELVDGHPLSDALARHGLPLARLLKIGIVVADAVAAAHQKGITHRDLKPANIMLGADDRDSRVKVLDFGLAKLADPAVVGGAATEFPTALDTGEGRILGTIAYMSPEQAEGKPIDSRSDLFSLGVVLYEMATGRRPFDGDTSVSILSSIVKDTPPSITELNPALPRELGRIIRRALAKDPEARYQTAKDLRNDLQDLLASLESGELTREAGSGAGQRARSVRLWQIVALVAALAAVASIVLLVLRGASPPPAPASAPAEMVRLTSGVNASRPVLSPDGKFAAYVRTGPDGADSVWVRQIATNSDVQIVPPQSGVRVFGLAVTPDGSFVDVLRWDQHLGLPAIWRVPLLGGPARQIVDRATSAPGWSPDGKQIAFLTQSDQGIERSVAVADASGEHVRVVATRKLPLRYPTVTIAGRPDVHPVWLPDGHTILIVGWDEREANRGTLVKVDIATGTETPVALASSLSKQGLTPSIALGPDGTSIIALAEPAEPDAGAPAQVWRVRLADGTGMRLTADLGSYFGVSCAGDTLVTTRIDQRSRLWMGDGAARELRPVGSEEEATRGNSIDWIGANRIAYVATLAGGSGMWTTDMTSGASQLLVPQVGRVVTSADGRTIVYSRDRDIRRAGADGAHPAPIAGVSGALEAIAPDGSAIFYISGQSGLQTAWTADLRRDGAPRQFNNLRVASGGIAVSPDSKWVALVVGRADERQVVIVPIDGGVPVRRFPAPPVKRIQWTPDGKAIAWLDATETNIWIQPIDGSAGHALTHFTDQTIFAFGWSPDGSRLALFRGVTTSDVVLLKGIR